MAPSPLIIKKGGTKRQKLAEHTLQEGAKWLKTKGMSNYFLVLTDACQASLDALDIYIYHPL